MNNFMLDANACALKNIENKFLDGGPFGAVIVKDGHVIARGRNTVLLDHDATAHAEVNAIREAGKVLNTHDLSGCEIWTNCYPCPMCLSAIIWSNIDTIYYGNTKEDAADIGFRDDYIYKIFDNINNSNLKIKQIDHDKTIDIFNIYKDTIDAGKY